VPEEHETLGNWTDSRAHHVSTQWRSAFLLITKLTGTNINNNITKTTNYTTKKHNTLQRMHPTFLETRLKSYMLTFTINSSFRNGLKLKLNHLVSAKFHFCDLVRFQAIANPVAELVCNFFLLKT